MKKAFTLAEVLLVLMIVGVLLGLCLGAGRSSLDKAYRLYFYRSFKGVSDSFSDFLARGKHQEYVCLNNKEKPDSTTDPKETYGPDDWGYVGVAKVHEAFRDHLIDLTDSGKGEIQYEVEGVSLLQDDKDNMFIRVKVTIPTLKTKQNKDGLIYYSILLTTGYELVGDGLSKSPAAIILENDGQSSDGSSLIPTGMMDSVGVFPVYIDDGEVGKYIQTDDSEADGEDGVTDTYTFKPIVPMSYREAFCLKYTSISSDENDKTTPIKAGTVAEKAFTNICGMPTGATPKEGRIRCLKPNLIRL